MPRFLANRVRKFLSFNGSSSYLTLPVLPSVTGFNLAFFVVKQNFTNNARIFDFQDSGPANAFCVLELTNGKLEFVTRNGGSTTGVIDGVKNTNGRLDHYAVTFDGTIMKVYENGVLINTDTSSVMTASLQTVFTIGKRSIGSTNFWKGKLGELVFQNTSTPWTAAEVSDLYYRGVIPYGASYYDFDNNVLDLSGNGKHGTLVNGSYVSTSARAAASARSLASNRMPIGLNPGKSLYFGADVNAVVAIPDAAKMRPDNTRSFTWAFWAYAYRFDNNALPRFVEKGSTYVCLMGDMTNGRCRNVALELANLVGGTATEFWGGTRLSPQKWYHIVATFDDITGRIYLNGVAETMTTIGGPYVSPMEGSSGVTTKLGNRNGGARNFHGLIAGFKMWNRALTAGEADMVYRGQPVLDGLQSDIDVDEGSGATVVDDVAANNGTISAATWRTHANVRTAIS